MSWRVILRVRVSKGRPDTMLAKTMASSNTMASEHNLLNEYQSGFRPKHSCEAALLEKMAAFLILKKSQQVPHKGQS